MPNRFVDLLKRDDQLSHSNDNIVVDYRKGLREIPSVAIQHCYREANRCADDLARQGAYLSQDFVVFLEPPSKVSLLLNLDSTEILYGHSIAVAVSFA